VGLINSTDELASTSTGGTSAQDEAPPTTEEQRLRRQERGAVGTPDYLAPEILLGTGHSEQTQPEPFFNELSSVICG
jgi:hypothetical protein